MTPPEHFLIGIAAGNIIYGAAASVTRKPPVSYWGTVTSAGVAAVLPDIDSFFGNYTSLDPMTGHRGVTHSIIGVGALGLGLAILWSIASMFRRTFSGYWGFLVNHFHKKETGVGNGFRFWRHFFFPFHPKAFMLLWLITFVGGLSHIFADMPTPPSVWGGMPLFFPFKNAQGAYTRIGGWGLIGWYDLRVFWYSLGACVLSVPPVVLGSGLRAIRLLFFRILAALVFSSVVAVNSYLFYWMKGHIEVQQYRDDNSWYVYQMERMKEMPPQVQDVTYQGMRLFVAVFKQARGIQ